jgi:multidrug efflux pump subunit AcrA (membrane-fusion protein)
MLNSSQFEVSGARLAGVAGLLAFAIAALGCSSSKGEAPPSAERAASAVVAVTTTTAETRVIPIAIDATGSFADDEASNVGPEVDGMIAATPVDVGTYVRKGAVLIRLDATEANLRLQQAKAAQQQAEATLLQAEARVGQTTSGLDVRALPEVAAARANYESALAQSKQAQADVNRYRGLLATGDIAGTVYEQR